MATGEQRVPKLYSSTALVLAGMAVAFFSFGGCGQTYSQAGTAQGRPLVGPFRAADANPFLMHPTEQRNPQKAVQLRIYKITVGKQSKDRAKQLQNLLKTALIMDNRAELLSRNGLLVSAGLADAWPKVLKLLGQGPLGQDPKAILEAHKRKRPQLIETYLPEGLEVQIPIAGSLGKVAFFWSDPRGQLLGKTYRSCYKLLLATASSRPNGQVQLRLVPVLKERATSLGTLLRQQKAQTGQPQEYLAKFEALAINVMVNPDEFLAIGSAGQGQGPSFGQTFFQKKNRPQADTIILLVVPRTVTYLPGEGFSQPKKRTGGP